MDATITVHTLSGWRRAVLWPAAALVKLWGATLRIEMDPPARALLTRTDQPVAFVLWHNRLFIAAEIYRRYRSGRPISALISASKDGAWLAAFFSLMGLQAVRGSSSRRGREAAEDLVDAVKSGRDAGITPDGPRGPCYSFKPGALSVARAAGAPILLFSCGYSAAWRLRSWDGFWLPKPFSTLRVVCEQADPSVLEDREHGAARLEARLRQLTDDRQA